MSAGLQRAALEALCSRGPWSGDQHQSGHHVEPWTLTEAELRDLYRAFVEGFDHPVGVALRVHGSHRKADRALQLLRGAGLIEYAGKPKRWRAVGGA